MTFKLNWEKADSQIQIPAETIQRMIELAFPEARSSTYETISGGCANLNKKLKIENDPNPYILRIYLRDKDAAYREQKIGILLKETIPIPQVIYINDVDNFRFAITQFIEGITLRDLLLGNESCDIKSIMYEVGLVLAKIDDHQFSRSGFFDKNLCIIESKEVTQDSWVEYALNCLKSPIVIQQLGQHQIMNINHLLKQYAAYFPNENDKQLVHADFDPANILVAKSHNTWEITAVLDWEFSFSGSVLCDVANMLRYAHEMPAIYEASFLNGLKAGGVVLPQHWRISVDLLNLLSLLDCLVNADPINQPNQAADIRNVIGFIVQRLQLHEEIS